MELNVYRLPIQTKTLVEKEADDFKWAKAVIDYISMVFRYSRFRSKTPGESIH